MNKNGLCERGGHIFVIGGGFAGLAAAKTLLQKGNGRYKVTILEGSNRVGGRAHSVELPNSGKVEMGATWFHGIVGNPLYDLAEQHGFMTGPRRKDAGWGSPQFIRQNQSQGLMKDEEAVAYCAIKTYGQVIDSLEGVNLSVELSMNQDIDEQLQKSLQLQDNEIPIRAKPGVSVGQLLRQKLKYMLSQISQDEKSIWDEDKIKVLNEAWQWRETLQRSIEGCVTTDEVCAQNYYEYQELPGPNVPVPNGFQNLAEILSQDIDIKYEHVVKQISWGQGQGQFWSQTQAQIMCENGEEFEADAVIISVSLGVLKNNHEQMFNPSLPQWKINSIERIGFGVVDKIFVEIPDNEEATQSWPDPNEEGNIIKDYRLLWKSKEVISGRTAQNGHPKVPVESRTHTHTNPHPVQTPNRVNASTSTSTLTPTYAPEANPTWERGVYSWRYWGAEFQQSRMGQQKRPSAALWITGQEALEMEGKSVEELKQGCSNILQMFPMISRPKSWQSNMHVYRSSWGTDPLFQGSYSFLKLGSSGEDLDLLFKPINVGVIDQEGEIQEVPVLSFCGEATSRQYFGTVHGAYLSGEKAANYLLNKLNDLANI